MIEIDNIVLCSYSVFHKAAGLNGLGERSTHGHSVH